jgi:hypothetical protein
MKLTPRMLATLAALAALAVAAPAAGAKKPEAGDTATPATPAAGDTAGCSNPATSSVFAQFRDRRSYFLAPDGGFEGGAAGWTLDGASVVDGNEMFNLGGTTDAHSLGLPAGSSATSPAICLERGHPLFRFVARTSGDKKSRLRVEVLYTNGHGKPSRVAGKLRAGNDWKPTKKLSLALGRALGKGRNATGSVQLRFTPVGTGDWQIDDVYVDPHARREGWRARGGGLAGPPRIGGTKTRGGCAAAQPPLVLSGGTAEGITRRPRPPGGRTSRTPARRRAPRRAPCRQQRNDPRGSPAPACPRAASGSRA